ncbi:hypothetical protein QYQ98_05660 [Corynebacterium sp. P3-F1]|uniref:hypothetical protein n=1 Tax=Corynebacterium sp. P3-F1 TaxID=3059080 RepID=UPI00265CCCD2|nr:hypothetical protein [Corynebacterium sp. P3-F1]WKK62356.1 hypothetical protein QYQ98_05660 [Corynebacterium sp. P3-F1]
MVTFVLEDEDEDEDEAPDLEEDPALELFTELFMESFVVLLPVDCLFLADAELFDVLFDVEFLVDVSRLFDVSRRDADAFLPDVLPESVSRANEVFLPTRFL